LREFTKQGVYWYKLQGLEGGDVENYIVVLDPPVIKELTIDVENNVSDDAKINMTNINVGDLIVWKIGNGK
jgi:hypothetical protein